MEISGWEEGGKCGGGARRKGLHNHQTNAGHEGSAETKKNENSEKAKDRPRTRTACLEEKNA